MHAVSFYDHDRELVDLLARFVADGLALGERVVVVATAPHRLALDDALDSLGVNPDRARKTGYYVALDAAAMLETFMRGGLPDADLFVRHVGNIVSHAARRRDAGAGLRRDGRPAVGRAQRDRRDAARGALERLRRAGRLLAPLRLPDHGPQRRPARGRPEHLRRPLLAAAPLELLRRRPVRRRRERPLLAGLHPRPRGRAGGTPLRHRRPAPVARGGDDGGRRARGVRAGHERRPARRLPVPGVRGPVDRGRVHRHPGRRGGPRRAAAPVPRRDDRPRDGDRQRAVAPLGLRRAAGRQGRLGRAGRQRGPLARSASLSA